MSPTSYQAALPRSQDGEHRQFARTRQLKAKCEDARPVNPHRSPTHVAAGRSTERSDEGSGADDSKQSVTFETPFTPAVIRVDPDVRMIQLRRKLAEWKP